MRKSDLCQVCLLASALLSTAQSYGQGSKNLPAPSSKAASEITRRLEKAQADREAEGQRSSSTTATLQRMQAAVDRARESGPSKPSYAEQTKDAESRQRLQEAMSRVSPAGQAILAQNAAAPNLRTPDESAASAPLDTKVSPLATGGSGPKPQPLKTTPLTTAAKPPSYTVINAGSAFFDSKAGFGVFVDDVVLDHPEFHLVADELEVYMNKDESAAGKEGAGAGAAPSGPTAGELAEQGAAEPAPKNPGPAPSERKASGNIKQAIAKGKRVVVSKLSPEGEPQTGIGREAIYDGATGDMILRGWPQIQKGTSLQVAKEPTTYFIIKANGQFFAQGGRSETRIVQEDKKSEPPPPDGAPSSVPTPPAPRPNP